MIAFITPKWSRLSGWGWLALLLGGCQPAAAVWLGPPYRYVQHHMGTRVELTLHAPCRALADAAATAAYRRIAELEQRMSDYRPDSEVRQLTRFTSPGQSTTVSRHLYCVLSRAMDISDRTEGAFDVTVGPLVKLWRRAARSGRIPDPTRIRLALQAVGYRHVRLGPGTSQVTLNQPGMRIDLGGIAKGYIADEALKTLCAHGVRAALVDAGGDLALGKAPPGRAGWRIGIAPAGQALASWTLSQCGVASSGDRARGFTADGRRWSHLIDPRTGWALPGGWSATVVADTCAEADALASAACVAGPIAARHWLQNARAVFAIRTGENGVGEPVAGHAASHNVGHDVGQEAR